MGDDPDFTHPQTLLAYRKVLNFVHASDVGQELAAEFPGAGTMGSPTGPTAPHGLPPSWGAWDQRGFAQLQGSSLLRAGWSRDGDPQERASRCSRDTRGTQRGHHGEQPRLRSAPGAGGTSQPQHSPVGPAAPQGQGDGAEGLQARAAAPWGARHGAQPPAPLRRAPHARSCPCQAWQLPSAPTLFLPRGCHRNPRPTCDDAASFGSAGSPAAPASDSSRGRGPLFLGFG